MAHQKTNTVKELKEKIKKRERLIAEIVHFIKLLTKKEGEIRSRYQGRSHTHVVREFKDFDGFNMFFSDGETMFGGTTVVLYDDSVKVFEIHYQSDLNEDCNVCLFRKDKKWQTKFKSAMRNKDAILKKKTEDKKRTEARYAKQVTDENKMEELRNKAKRLGL